MPHVLIDAEGRDTAEAGLIRGHLLKQRFDGPPHRSPRRPELPRQPEHRRVLAAQLPDRPPTRTGRQQRAGPGHIVALLGHQPARTVGFGAPPGPLAPGELDRPAEARRVDQPYHAAAVTAHHDAADPATLDPRGRLDLHSQIRPASASHLLHRRHVQPVETDEKITARAVTTGRTRARARRTLGHRRGLPIDQLGRYRSLGGLDPSPRNSAPRVAHTHLRYEEPHKRGSRAPVLRLSRWHRGQRL